jgi:hypothetical protein
MKELKLDEKGFLVDFYGIRFKRGEPVLTLELKMTTRNNHIFPQYFEQQISNLRKEGKLKKESFVANAYLVADRRNIDNKGTIQRSWGSEEYNYVESCTIELYNLEKKFIDRIDVS